MPERGSAAWWQREFCTVSDLLDESEARNRRLRDGIQALADELRETRELHPHRMVSADFVIEDLRSLLTEETK